MVFRAGNAVAVWLIRSIRPYPAFHQELSMNSGKNTAKPRVLAITVETFAVRQLRLDMPLCNLKRRGLIDDYLITDHFFQNLPDDYQFDTVWVQRMVNEEMCRVLAKVFDNNFLYDLDDFLIGHPTYTMTCFDGNCEWQQTVKEALRSCKVFTGTTNRLVATLEACSGASLSPKALICPNGFEFPQTVRKPQRPVGMIWTSSDFPALTQSREPLLNAISRFSEKYDLPVYSFGYFNGAISRKIRNLVELGPIPFFHHKVLLGSFPPLIGVAPLETSASQADLDFINSKSDLKMVEFGGFGHPSVYSDAPPYTDTDLRCGVVTSNHESSWFEALEMILREKWKELDTEQAGVVETRNMERIASELWYEAILRVRMDRLLSGADAKNGLKRPRKEALEAQRASAARMAPREPISRWNDYDNVYHFWKEYKKRRLLRHEALKLIDERYGLLLFLVLYPLYKAVKPFRNLKKSLKKRMVRIGF
jgi:hypothetical protein